MNEVNNLEKHNFIKFFKDLEELSKKLKKEDQSMISFNFEWDDWLNWGFITYSKDIKPEYTYVWEISLDPELQTQATLVNARTKAEIMEKIKEEMLNRGFKDKKEKIKDVDLAELEDFEIKIAIEDKKKVKTNNEETIEFETIWKIDNDTLLKNWFKLTSAIENWFEEIKGIKYYKDEEKDWVYLLIKVEEKEKPFNWIALIAKKWANLKEIKKKKAKLRKVK